MLPRPISFKKYIFFNIYLLLRDRETQSMSREGAERGGDTESDRHKDTEPDTGLEPTNCEIMT